MLKRVGFIFLAILVVALVYDAVLSVAHAVTSQSPGVFSLPSLVTADPVADSDGGLTSVDFSTFAKGGKGWNYITQGYGNTPYSYMYINHWHNGIDIGADYGAPIYSPVTDGIVLATGDQDDYCPRLAFGRFVDLLFAHLNQIFVTPGEAIQKGAKVATVGATGDETGSHLHFSVFEAAGFSMAPAHGCGPYPQGHDINPVPYLESVQ
jgi:murein DD-endopeptidase MepM/ murein hydrolase activator NlpD